MTAQASATTGFSLLPLKRFQERRRDDLVGIIRDTAQKIAADPTRRREIALAQGVTLLRSPTGSGKTLVMGRTLEQTVGILPNRTVWFWFAPYAGLVAQTREALMAQCPGLRMRDVQTDRSPQGTRDGDVFVTTWASVAAANKDARRVRQAAEEVTSIDLLVAALRADGWHVGAVIDEAHVNFGTSAKQAAAFYLEVLKPDFTLLATATPKDEDLEKFEKLAGIAKLNRIDISRDEVVRACLNKVGIKAVHFRPDPKDEQLLDMEEVAIYAGLARHRLIRQALAAAGVKLTPLLMIQVENVGKGQPDPVEKVREVLKAQKVPSEAIAVHTSGEPDPYFHTLAYDETKEVLIFKVAAATGFDAPRAWTLVSLRRSIGVEFGLQVLGRIMRVHPRVQGVHPFAASPAREEASPLDFGYVFLANPDQQTGIAAAADEIRTIADGIRTVTDNVVVIDFGTSKAALLDPAHGFAELLDPPPAPQPDPAAVESTMEPSGGKVGAAVAPEEATPSVRTRSAALAVQSWLLFDSAPGGASPTGQGAEVLRLVAPEVPRPRAEPERRSYPLRSDIVFPRKLAREVMPRTMDGLVACIAQRIKLDGEALTLVNKTRGKVVITEEDVFGGTRTTGRENVPISNLRIAQQAQFAFRFNEGIDERDLKPALLRRLKQQLEDDGHEVPEERDLRRAVDLLAMARPELLHDACRACLAQVVEIRQNEEIPPTLQSVAVLERAERSVYGVFPDDMNGEELAFARALDEDKTGTVVWWLRNVANARWAVSIVLPNGKLHYPDFVVGVDARRKTPDGIALVEVKDDGRTGRLYAEVNTDKVRTEHREYRSALMVFRDERGQWFNVAYRADIQRHQIGKKFDIDDLVWTAQ